ncbi:TetR/AcrR family transcriptional regulator [Amphritea sp. 1_MG-2023]|uniref:TetR/AcrR family transcriptional regulator n=1 Tax=Amphritea sp. 1_MG-2023 TaxID=3062670 RepID=UPI0026E2BEA0|nr:TetR/AcrR family transcriptional regulator [Amphritea sp. 1_MG-2023]MDO6562402.1 TetR/AcrR family transcriptional regulator [Amphritea sp. 1_MG-2023]
MSNLKYDRQDVIDRATDLFWAKGYHATSMRNLQEVVDMRPGSIYACFGSKDGLFKETLQHYAQKSQQRLKACLAASASPLDGLKLFVRGAVTDCSTSAPSGMCMLVKTISELTQENTELLVEAQQLLQGIEAMMASILRQAQEQGEINATKSPERLARSLQVQLMGLRVYASTSTDSQQLDQLIEDLFDNLR